MLDPSDHIPVEVIMGMVEVVPELQDFLLASGVFDVKVDFVGGFRLDDGFEEVEIDFVVQRNLRHLFLEAEDGLVRYDDGTEVDVLVVKEVVENIHIVVEFGRRDGVPFQLTGGFEAVFDLNLPETLEDFGFGLRGTPDGSESHRADVVVFKVTGFVTVY